MRLSGSGVVHVSGLRAIEASLELADVPGPKKKSSVDFPGVSLDEPLRNSQPEPHAGGSSVQPLELFKNPLLVLGSNPSTRIRDADFHAVRTAKPNPSPLFHRGSFRHTPLPEVRTRAQCHRTARRYVFECVVKEIFRHSVWPSTRGNLS